MSVVERETVVPVVAPVTTRDVLHRAADLLEEFGWCQYSFARDSMGRLLLPSFLDAGCRGVKYCAVGAVYQAAHDLGANANVFYNRYSMQEHWDTWNDEHGRDKADVVARLRAAAEAHA